MARYDKNFLTQVVIRADLVSGTAPEAAAPGEGIQSVLVDFPERTRVNRSRTEVTVQKTPQGPVKNTRTITFVENNYFSDGRTLHAAVCGEYIFLATKTYRGFAPLRDVFTELMDAAAAQCPGLRIRRLGMRYVNEIKLPEADAGPGLGADFWAQYINPLLLGGLRFAANDGALARHMCTTELNYGTDRATIRYGIFNGEYPKPNRRREFILDVDTYCQGDMTADAVGAKLSDYHTAACQVFEAAITDALRARLGRA